MARKVHGDRALLNLPGHHSTAAIVAEIESTAHWPDGKGRHGKDPTSYNISPEVTFSITDCDNKVNIEIEIGSEAKLENSLHKLDTMIACMRKLRKGLQKEHDLYVYRYSLIPDDKRYEY